MSVRVPPMKWTQVGDNVFLTVTVCDLTDVKIDFEPRYMTFSGKQGNQEYGVKLEFFGAIAPENCRWTQNGQCVSILIEKDESEKWKSLLKDKNLYKHLIQVDWDHYQDSDDEDNAGTPALPGNFESLMKQYQSEHHHEDGCDSCDSCDSDESSEEEMPPLESTE